MTVLRVLAAIVAGWLAGLFTARFISSASDQLDAALYDVALTERPWYQQ